MPQENVDKFQRQDPQTLLTNTQQSLQPELLEIHDKLKKYGDEMKTTKNKLTETTNSIKLIKEEKAALQKDCEKAKEFEIFEKKKKKLEKGTLTLQLHAIQVNHNEMTDRKEKLEDMYSELKNELQIFITGKCKTATEQERSRQRKAFDRAMNKVEEEIKEQQNNVETVQKAIGKRVIKYARLLNQQKDVELALEKQEIKISKFEDQTTKKLVDHIEKLKKFYPDNNPIDDSIPADFKKLIDTTKNITYTKIRAARKQKVKINNENEEIDRHQGYDNTGKIGAERAIRIAQEAIDQLTGQYNEVEELKKEDSRFSDHFEFKEKLKEQRLKGRWFGPIVACVEVQNKTAQAIAEYIITPSDLEAFCFEYESDRNIAYEMSAGRFNMFTAKRTSAWISNDDVKKHGFDCMIKDFIKMPSLLMHHYADRICIPF